jgi:hypothetical protein
MTNKKGKGKTYQLKCLKGESKKDCIERLAKEE